MSLDAALRDVIACPVCHGSLDEVETAGGTSELVCSGCRLAYPIQDGIPVLLADQARHA
ncbi:Trm112 family protein [Phytoactinopolyspora alkaliphila]|uniref:UPF0434 protein G1H11_18450 n=1 Tax=Phytoactinopolyspora alkaliphila TaxID=1783498 RepID=A0A6N9YQM7_9ACTN|nr:Trm112 family protein [Phytoactinopolyspora alkaliphila]NED97282.1 Trm112 family protein [Phytoactinopolyspora alkaliphila]